LAKNNIPHIAGKVPNPKKVINNTLLVNDADANAVANAKYTKPQGKSPFKRPIKYILRVEECWYNFPNRELTAW
jgi:hypothetical protein